MEGALAEMVKKEEGRAIDEFNYEVFPSDPPEADAGKPQPSPLSRPPRENYVLGYFQNNPDGSFQTPLVAGAGPSPPDFATRIEALKEANEIFNRKRVTVTDRIQPRPAEIVAETEVKQDVGLADRYLDNISGTKRKKTRKDHHQPGRQYCQTGAAAAESDEQLSCRRRIRIRPGRSVFCERSGGGRGIGP